MYFYIFLNIFFLSIYKYNIALIVVIIKKIGIKLNTPVFGFSSKTLLYSSNTLSFDNEQQFSDPFLSYTSYIIHEVASPSIKSFIPTDQVHAPLIDLSVDSST